eukprot:SAG11_NODE_2256_length_3614_cov_19.820199_1_plen_49_part_00
MIRELRAKWLGAVAARLSRVTVEYAATVTTVPQSLASTTPMTAGLDQI